jgi:hypothetical protein
MPIPTYDAARVDQVLEAREALRQDVREEKLTSGSILQYYRSILEGLNKSEQESSFWHGEEAFAVLSEQLGRLHVLASDWDSYGAPTPAPATIANARSMLRRLRRNSLLPEVIAPSAEGGVSIYFSQGPQKAFIEFSNEGDVLFARYGKDDEPNVRVLQNGLQDLDDQVLQEIRGHIGGRA